MIDYESHTTFWFMAFLIFYAPLITPHPPHSLGHLLTVPHLHFNKGGSQTLIPSSFMSIDSSFILPHGPQPTGKSRERGIPPCFCHICHIWLDAILGMIPMEGKLQYLCCDILYYEREGFYSHFSQRCSQFHPADATSSPSPPDPPI